MKWIKENWLLLFLAAVIAAAAVSSWKLVNYIQCQFGSFFPKAVSRDEWGMLGDLFGGILNPFFALLGLVMLLVTLFQNQRELSLSRKEFEESAEALKSQAETLEKQRFEDTFFSLLSQHNIALNNITKERIDYDLDGKQSKSKSIATTMKVKFVGGGPYLPLIHKFSGLEQSRDELLKENNDLNQYFRILYQVLKFIALRCPGSTAYNNFSVKTLKSTSCSNEEKLYSNIVRALMSDDVYYLLAINCWCADSADSFYKYKLLVERYSFLEHMPLVASAHANVELIQELARSYEESAFGDNQGYLAARHNK